MRRILVVGLGRFGKALVRALAKEDVEVLAVDPVEAAVREIQDAADHVAVGDIRDPMVLGQLCEHGVDAAIVSISDSVAESALATMILKELEVPNVVARAERPEQERLLRKLGADRLVVPVRESAERLARSIASPAIEDFVLVGENFAIIEAVLPKEFEGRTLEELELRRRFGVNVIGILERPEEEPDARPSLHMPEPTQPLNPGQVLLIIGRSKDLRRFQEI